MSLSHFIKCQQNRVKAETFTAKAGSSYILSAPDKSRPHSQHELQLQGKNGVLHCSFHGARWPFQRTTKTEKHKGLHEDPGRRDALAWDCSLHAPKGHECAPAIWHPWAPPWSGKVAQMWRLPPWRTKEKSLQFRLTRTVNCVPLP